MFLMNFLFDAGDNSGLFGLDVPGIGAGQVLKKSKNWLKLDNAAVAEPADGELPGLDPDRLPWIDEGEMDSAALLLPSAPQGKPDESSVGIRLAVRDGSSQVPSGATMTVTVCFGRPSQARQKRASPFQDAQGNILTTFVFTNEKANRRDENGNPVWYFPVGRIHADARPKGSKHQAHRFEFSVGAILNDGTKEIHYSHDPEMDVTT